MKSQVLLYFLCILNIVILCIIGFYVILPNDKIDNSMVKVSVMPLKETEQITMEPAVDPCLPKFSINSSQISTLIAMDSTVRSCLGDCFEAKPDGSSFYRIGILSLPFSGGEILSESIRSAADLQGIADLEIINESNVPAYGYGKSHGWSRIVRVYRNPLEHVMELAKVSKISECTSTYYIRQMMRWNCRLSHVAAHTKVLSVYFEDLLLRPKTELEKVMSFIGVKNINKVKVADEADRLLAKLTTSSSVRANGDTSLHNPQNFVDNLNKFTSSYLSDVQFSAILRRSIAEMENELRISKNLTDWPCKTFYSAGTFPQVCSEAIMESFSPDYLHPKCGSKFVTCFVDVDKNKN